MNLELKDKVALVTGGNRGIGAAAAEALAAEGACLFLTARDRSSLEAISTKLRECQGATSVTMPADLTEPEAAERVASAALARFGRIDILVNSAGSSQGGLFWDIPDEVWEQSFALKLMGSVRMMRAVVPTMRRQGAGRVITVVGNTGKQPLPRMLPGAAANAALLAITSGLAQELAAENIAVLAVNPGPTRTDRWTALMETMALRAQVDASTIEQRFTDQIPTGRLSTPEEIGRLVAFLASEAVGNITGTSVTVDGGWTKALA